MQSKPDLCGLAMQLLDDVLPAFLLVFLWPRILTGTYASKKQAAIVQVLSQCTHRLFLGIGSRQPARAGF